MALHLTAPRPKIKLNMAFIENCMLNYFTSTIFTYQLVCLRLFLSIANLSSNSWITSSSNHCQLKWLLFLEHFLRHESTPEGLVLPLLMICDMTGDKAKGNLPFSAAASSSSSSMEGKKKHMRTSGKGASKGTKLRESYPMEGPCSTCEDLSWGLSVLTYMRYVFSWHCCMISRNDALLPLKTSQRGVSPWRKES